MELKIFKDHRFGKIRILERNGEPWFVGKEIATTLGYSDVNKAVAMHVDIEDKKLNDKTSPSFGQRGTTLINESGLYSLVLSSKLPSAKAFKRWITSEVLPTIRRHGAYMTEEAIQKAITEPDFLIQLATELKQEQEARRKAEQKLMEAQPKVLFADSVSASNTSILVADMAKLLKQNGHDIGQKRLFHWLRENGYLIKRKGSDYNSPTQRAMERGLFELKETAITHADGHVSVSKTPKITGRGQLYFVNKFLGGEI